MNNTLNFKRLGASTMTIAFALSAHAFAQDGGDGEFIGTITLGESKRAVQTDTAAAITVIDKEEIDDRQAGTVAELIDSVPGVTLVNGSTPSGSGINIRGFGANSIYGTDQKVAILVDGATTGAEEIYRIGTQLFTDPYLYKTVTVSRGTVGSFEYGSGIVGGVVRLETIDASDLTGGENGFKLAQTLGATTNNAGFNTSSTLAIQPDEGIEILGNFTYREQSSQNDGDGNTIGNSAFELPSFLVKAKYSFGQDRARSITASFTQTDTQERDVPYDTFITSTDIFGNVDRDIKTQVASLTYAYAPIDNDLIDLEVQFTYSNQKIDQTYIPFSSPFGGEFGFGTVNADHQYENYKLTIKNGSYLETGPVTHNLRYGTEFLRRDRKDASAAPGGNDDRFAFFVIDELTVFDALTITPAVRYETSQIDATIFNGSANEAEVSLNSDAFMGGVSARYEIQPGLAVFGSWAQTENLPILDDLESSTEINGTRLIDVSEKAETFEGGFSYDVFGGFLGEGNAAALKLNYYNTELDDITTYSSGSLDRVELDGFEIEASLGLASGTYVDLNANIVSGTEISFTGAEVDWRNLTQNTVQATLGQRVEDFLDLSAEVVTAFERDTADSFTVANFRATATLPEGPLAGLQIRFGLENAFNEQYQPLLSTRPAPGRNFKVTISNVFF
ncbi:MAG: TonB-dependent receptor [Pseudomonadota bacterium]